MCIGHLFSTPGARQSEALEEFREGGGKVEWRRRRK